MQTASSSKLNEVWLLRAVMSCSRWSSCTKRSAVVGNDRRERSCMPLRSEKTTNRIQLTSKAFERASLKSESSRIIAVLCVLIAVAVFIVLRGLATKQYLLLVSQAVVVALMI